MACSAIVHGVEPTEESLLKYISHQEISIKDEISDMNNMKKTKLGWKIRGTIFEDGSKLENWNKIEETPWSWQYDDHELNFGIFEYQKQFWKLFKSRKVPFGTTRYEYQYGGQACRVAQVQYKELSRSAHSGLLKDKGDVEWVRVEEIDEKTHIVLKQ